MYDIHLHACVCLHMTPGQVSRHYDQRRMSTASYDKYTTYHRYDSDSSLDIVAHTRHDSIVPPRKTFRHSLPRLAAASLRGRDRHSSGSQSHENMQLSTPGHSESNEGYLRSNDTRDEGDEIKKGELIDRRDRMRSQDMEPNKDWVPKDDSLLNESLSRSRSADMVCVNCGCERSNVVTSTSLDRNPVVVNHADTVIAELDQLQGCAAERNSRDDDSHETIQSRADITLSNSGGQNTVPLGVVGGEVSRSSGVFSVESYHGDVSRQLCQQLLELQSDLNSARDLNIDVCTHG